jgi:uncharacterized membrane protein YfcA
MRDGVSSAGMHFGWLIPADLAVAPWIYFALGGVATLLTGFSKGGFGGGLGVIATPIMLTVLPARAAVSFMLPLLIVCDIFTVRRFPREWDPPSFRMLAGGTVVGLVIGLGLMVVFVRGRVDGEFWLRLIIGVASLLFCALKGWRWMGDRRRDKQAAPRPPLGYVAGTAIGVVAGVTTMLAHAAGPVVDMFLLNRRLDRRPFVGTASRYYLVFNSIKVPLFILAGMLGGKAYLSWETAGWSLAFVPLCPLGVWAGTWLNRRMSGETFTRLIYVLLLVTGVRMVWKALAGP